MSATSAFATTVARSHLVKSECLERCGSKWKWFEFSGAHNENVSMEDLCVREWIDPQKSVRIHLLAGRRRSLRHKDTEEKYNSKLDDGISSERIFCHNKRWNE